MTGNAGEMIRLTASDGHSLDAWLARAARPANAGLVILQEIFGVTEQLQRLASRYAAAGYDVVVPALFDRRESNAVVSYTDYKRALDLVGSMQLDDTMRDVDAAVQMLKTLGVRKVGVVGFCWGGGLTIRAAQTLGIDAAVSFYGTNLPKYLDRPLHAPLQYHSGLKDTHVPPEAVQQLADRFPEVGIHRYDAGHAFTNDARPEMYNASAAATAYERASQFLSAHLRPATV